MLVGLALGTLLSLGATSTVWAAGADVAAPAPGTDEGIEVVVVTARRPVPVYEVVVTGKRASKTKADRTPPAMAVEVPKLELARSERPKFRL